MQPAFRRFAEAAAGAVGSPWAFVGAVVLVLGWALLGPVFKFSDTWQLVINTTTTIITFLMVFLIQNTQNRDNRALHLKLDELVASQPKASNEFVDVEQLPDDQLDQLHEQLLARIAQRSGN